MSAASIPPGSILKNLLLGAQHSTYCVLPTHEEAWRVAEMCGLEAEFLRAPDTFNVGKGGRNLPISARQCLCLARCILSDPSVLLLHKPLSLLSVETATRVLSTFKMYVDYGGLHGMLSRQKRFHSEAATAYVIGNGTRQAPAHSPAHHRAPYAHSPMLPTLTAIVACGTCRAFLVL